MIEDLRYRLLNHRPFTPPLEGVGFDYGFNSDYLHSWVDYWANHYDFQKREYVLNHYPQYITNIQGLNIHFLWVKPNVSIEITEIGTVIYLFKKTILWLCTLSNSYNNDILLAEYRQRQPASMEISHLRGIYNIS